MCCPILLSVPLAIRLMLGICLQISITTINSAIAVQIAASTSADMRAVNQELDALREQARSLVELIEKMKRA